MTFNCLFEWVTKFAPIFKDLCLALAAVGGVVIALLGLRTWWRELKGKTEYDLARRILIATYKIRDAIQTVRNPFMSTSEYAGTESGKNEKDAQYQGIAEAYQKRWNFVNEGLIELDVVTLEAEAIWGSELIEDMKPLKECSKELFVKIKRYLLTRQSEVYREQMSQEKWEKIDKTIYSGGSPDDDEFYRRLLDAVKKIEERVKPRLQR
jgi:hypothetical protein